MRLSQPQIRRGHDRDRTHPSHVSARQPGVARTLETARLRPDLLSAHEVRTLQRRLGNHALGNLLSRPQAGAPPKETIVQRLLSVKDYAKRVTAQDEQKAELDTIRQALSDYHDIKPKNDPQYQVRLASLNGLERAIHAFFIKHVTAAIAHVPNAEALQQMLNETENEHRKLVAAVAKNPNMLPIDTKGLSKDERKDLLDLWRSIVNGTGNLKIKSGITEGKFKDRMLSGLARLLETPAGRTLLAEINATRPKGQEVVLGSSFKKELKKFGRTDPTTSQAVPKTQEGDVKSMAFSVAKDSPDPEDVVDYKGKNDPTEFNTFLTSLPAGTTHFRFNGTVYKLGTGVGSYVKMAGKGHVEESIGTRGQEVLTPEFITLGHELGHSLRMLKGTTVPFVFDTKELGFTGGEDQRKLWNNAEEFVNIKAVEGSLREQHGIESRQYHAGDWLKTQGPIVRSQMDKLLISKEAQKHAKEFEALFAIYTDITKLKGDDERLTMLTSPETRKAMQDLEHAMGPEKSETTTEPSLSGVSGPDKSEGVSGSPAKLEGGSDLGKEALTESTDDSSSESELGDLEGTPFDILNARAALQAEVPIDQGRGELGGPSSKTSGGKGGKSGYAWLAQEDYHLVRDNFEKWLRRHHIRAVPNNGDGRNNCLIISLVQLAKGSEAAPSSVELNRFKAELNQFGVGPDQALMPTDEAFKSLVTAINKKYKSQIRPVYAIAFKGQNPPYALISSDVGTTPVVVWDKMGHYEALVRA